MNNKGESLKNGIVVVLAANIINLCISLFRNFIIPKFLPIDTYAEIKLYQLINSYGGLIALGYIDGIHIRYGGLNISEIDKCSFIKNLSTFRIMELTIVSIIVICGVYNRNFIFVMSALSVLAINITGYYSSLFQATGLYTNYTKILNSSSILLLIMNMVLLFGVRTYIAMDYIIGYLLIYLIIWIVVEILFSKLSGIKLSFFQFSFNEIKDTIQTGFFLMWGLLASNFITGMDRWFVKGLLSTSCFAMYSFAASTEGFLGYAVSPISITMYNFFCKVKDNQEIIKIKDCIILFSTVIIGSAFGVKLILEHILTKYSEANKVMFILFASQLPYSIIKCLFLNLYKAQKRQKEYFKKIIIIVFIGFLFNIIAYSLYKEMETFAIATLLSSFLLCMICCSDFKEIKFCAKEFIYIAIVITFFLICGFTMISYIGLFVYYSMLFLLSIIVYRSTLLYMLNITKKYFFNKRFYIHPSI